MTQRTRLKSKQPVSGVEEPHSAFECMTETALPMALNVGLPIGCLAATPGTDGDQLLAAGLTQFVGRYWTGEVVLLSAAVGSTALVTLGKSSLRAGVAGLGWLPVQSGTGKG